MIKKMLAVSLFWISATGVSLAVDFPHWDISTYCEKTAAAKYSSDASKIARADCIAKQSEAREKLKYLQDPNDVAQECAEQVGRNIQGNYVALHQCIVDGNR